MSVHTRVVRRKQRADTRASTEPHASRGPTEVDSTTPYRRDFEPQTAMENADHEAVPYCEIEVSSGVSTADTPKIDTQEITNPKPTVDTEAETTQKPTLDLDDVLQQLKPELLAKGSGEVAAIGTERAPTRPANWSWLGTVVTQPQVGASLVIGARTRADFCVTSPITHLFPREGGTLVLTSTKSRYFVEAAGDAYLVRKVR